ncbi:hypothetical protein [Kurthia sibirica]|uniref:hypothetical protein n=1 Tax=Kurthia sibirica TaxID=202750 RepID=UPI0011720C7F|nr:hypothetical protein [Kurthia sibirica]GEK35449.1 hypothetical protein KSI01_29820 [Kurthia sibirica]
MAEKPLYKRSREQKAIEALIMFPTIKEAAAHSQLSESTLYRYLNNDDFKESYRNAKKEIMRGVSNSIQMASMIAIRTLIDVMENPKANAMARVTASSKMLELAYQSHRDEDVYAELEDLKEMVEAIKGSKVNDF